MKGTALVYIVAGISSRFGGRIKQFAKVSDTDTLIEYSLKQAIPAGFSKIIFVVGNMTEKPFREKFGDSYFGIPIEYILQSYDRDKRDRPWGTGDALCSIRDVIDCPFVICNGDDLYGESTFRILHEHLQKSDEAGTIGYRIREVLPDAGNVNRGIFNAAGDYVTSIKEAFDVNRDNLSEKELTENSLCSMNIFALHPETVHLLYEELKNFKEIHKEDRKLEFILGNELSKLIEAGNLRMKLYPTPDGWLGITNPGDEDAVRKALGF
jgi:NDP-sugar pyrophosphorylase family protein